MWLDINCGKNMDHECISFLCSMHGSLYLYKHHLGTFGSSCMIKVFLMLEVLHASILMLVFECTTYTTMFMLRPSHSQALCFGVSKWRIFVWQSPHGLCKTSQDNPKMIMFSKDEMTLKTTLLMCKLTITSNALVLCVTSPKEKLLSSMTSTINPKP